MPSGLLDPGRVYRATRVRLPTDMTRKRTPDDVQARVLTRSRRRCCICYGLNRDTSIKQGQIAHIDQNSANSAEENIVFLCMPCHDKYDSTTRQSKNFTATELKHFRED